MDFISITILAILSLKIKKILFYAKIRYNINKIKEDLESYFIKKIKAQNAKVLLKTGLPVSINKIEKSNICFLIPISLGSKQYYSFLETMQKIGFDIYPLFANVPKGEKHAATMPLPRQVKAGLPRENSKIKILQKISIWRFLKHKITDLAKSKRNGGRLHIRTYKAANQQGIIITAHIDLPRWEHLYRIDKHLKDKIATDYNQGEELFAKLLLSLGMNVREL